jgi:hypothetical protein
MNSGIGTYRDDLYYINTLTKSGLRTERVVSRARFYLTWLWWYWTPKRYREFRQFNVLYQTRKGW